MELHKKLKFIDIFCIASGAMISSGIFILPGIAYSKAGPSIILGYFIGGVIALFGVVSIIELSTAMPKAGGNYFFVNKTFGPMMGTISGILSWFALSLKTSLAIYGISEVLGRLLFTDPTYWQLLSISIISIILFSILNIVGLDIASKFEVSIVVFLIAFILIYIFSGIFSINFSNFTPFVENFTERGRNLNSIESFEIILGLAAFVFVSYGGLLNVSSIAEEVISPEKNIPRGMFASVISTTLMYSLLLFVTIGNIPNPEFLMTSLTPIADTSKLFLGKVGFIMILITSMLAFISTANAGIMSASRYPLALSRDGLLPEEISIVNKKYGTPIRSIIITAILIMISIIFPLESLAKVASAVVLLAYVLTNLAVIILRESGIRNYQPTFKSPFYPWIQLLSIIMFIFFIMKLGFFPNLILILFIFLGFLIYYKFGKENQQEYALLHLMLKITSGIELNHDLERELRDIIHERENIELDEFDYLIKEAPVIDVEEKKTIYSIIDENFDLFKNFVDISKDEFISLFKKREELSTTVIDSFTAIPHITLNNKDDFKLIIIRGQNGITFRNKKDNVKAIFLFLGCPECTKIHLRSLAAIAYLVKEQEFEEQWIDADTEQHLRDILLLSKRKRWNS